jgi:hypothetical protein
MRPLHRRMTPMRYLPPLAALALMAVAGSGAPQPTGAQFPPLREAPPGSVSLIVNGDMESDDGWRFSDWPPRPDTGASVLHDAVVYSEAQAHSGRRSVRIDLTRVGEDRFPYALTLGVAWFPRL